MDDPTGRIEWLNLFCGASPQAPEFDFYTGEQKKIAPDAPPRERFQFCKMINDGECRLFEEKEG